MKINTTTLAYAAILGTLVASILMYRYMNTRKANTRVKDAKVKEE